MTRSTLAEPPLSGMRVSARHRGGLIALVVTEVLWLAICGGLAFRHASGLPYWLFVLFGATVTVTTAIAWIRVTFEAAVAVGGVAIGLAILAGLLSATVQIVQMLSGPRPAHDAGTLGWALLTAFLSLIEFLVVVGIFSDLEERQETVLLHAKTIERLAGIRWFGISSGPTPELLLPLLAIPGVHAHELTRRDGFRYAVAGGERVALICLEPPDDPEELAAQATSWAKRLRAADDNARVRGVLVVDARDLPPGRILALGVTPATPDDLLDTVGPWLGEPNHLNVAIAATLMPSKTN